MASSGQTCPPFQTHQQHLPVTFAFSSCRVGTCQDRAFQMEVDRQIQLPWYLAWHRPLSLELSRWTMQFVEVAVASLQCALNVEIQEGWIEGPSRRYLRPPP